MTTLTIPEKEAAKKAMAYLAQRHPRVWADPSPRVRRLAGKMRKLKPLMAEGRLAESLPVIDSMLAEVRGCPAFLSLKRGILRLKLTMVSRLAEQRSSGARPDQGVRSDG